LGVDEAAFARRIALLEDASLQTGVDIRLTTGIRSNLGHKMRDLGLDAKDTTAEELYHALRIKAQDSEKSLLAVLGTKTGEASNAILKAIAKHFSSYAKEQKVWSIKKTAVKKLLKELPPNKTMKSLRYRSQVSMLKRESPTELYALASLIEGDTYKNKLMGALKKLKPSDFEERALEIVCVDEKRWIQIKKNLHVHTVPVFSLPEISKLIVLPVSITRTDCLALLSAALMLKEIRHIKEHAAYLKLKTLDPNLRTHIEIIANKGRIPLFTLHDEQVYWHHLHHLLGRQSELPEHIGPHMSSKDLEWVSIEAHLTGISKDLGFWVDTHNVAFVNSRHVVSMHIIDVCMSALYDLTVDTSSVIFVREIVADELLEAYLEVPPFKRFMDEHTYKLTDIDAEILYA
jgi:hypothetical protein